MAATTAAAPSRAASPSRHRCSLAAARSIQFERADALRLNAQAEGEFLERIAAMEPAARTLLARAAESGGLTARGWTRVVRLARTIADLEASAATRRVHVAEALAYRRVATPPVGAV